jgi:hypothetical protein
VARLNFYRSQASLEPVELDYDLSRGCQLHANYLAGNAISLAAVGLNAHEESAAMPGYSTEGAAAGRNSVIYQGVAPVQAIDNWMRTFYHRMGFLNPNLTHVGFGSAGEYRVMDIGRGKLTGPLAQEGVRIWPPAGSAITDGSFQVEIPMPVNDNSMGVPISVEYYGPWLPDIYGVSARLRSLSHGGAPVPIYINSPGDPLNSKHDVPYAVVMIPRDPLAPGVYEASVAAQINDITYDYSWEFTVL